MSIKRTFDVANIETTDTDYKRNLKSPFQPNATLIFGEEKLSVRKEDLMAESPVFNRLFSPGFKEADSNEVDLPGKNLDDFVHFLRCILPGFQDKLTESIVHNVLPLAHEYQVEKLLTETGMYLADMVKENGNNIKSDKLIDYILEAEKFNLQKYLDECIVVASRKKYESFVNTTLFSNITANTRLKISLKRWKDIDALINKSSSELMYKNRNSGDRTECMREHQNGEICMGYILKERFTQNT